ncbi:Reverse transcriptase domain [Cinara cedri]|uniref:Reverse transcriptase domain n=1 Tax=Cinara cedri TaxID=506608 RepID=A0A5E4MQ54_9HEMI|nr:Reverse transcriptase domain [Cinara cedri]
MTWKLISEITGSKLSSNDNIIKLKNNDCEINAKNDPITASNMLNNFFINIALNSLNKPTNHFRIKPLKDNTAAGLDKVSVNILKRISKFVVHPLAYIYNLSIVKNIFPETLKVADVKPLLKGGNKSNMNNYRPVSMMSIFSKIFEKIIKARLIEFLEKNKLSKNQFGFRPGLSTDNALYKVAQFLYSNLDNSNKSISIFLDLAKAFDFVNHEILLNLLPSFGINNSSLNSKRFITFKTVKLKNLVPNQTIKIIYFALY